MATVYLGNVNPIDADVDGPAVTMFNTPDDVGLVEALTTITRAYDEYHSEDPPEWVESDNNALAAAIADNYSWPAGDGREKHTCKVGRPKSWKGLDFTDED